jgi:hypothetical protein
MLVREEEKNKLGKIAILFCEAWKTFLNQS